MSEEQATGGPAHAGHPPGCEVCAILGQLRSRIAELTGGEQALVIAALDALDNDDVGRLFSLLAPPQRRSILGSLGVGGGKRRLLSSSFGFVAMRMRQEPEPARVALARMLTWAVWDEVIRRATELDGDEGAPAAEAIAEAAGELVSTHSAAIVRLAIAACWDESPDPHVCDPVALGILFSDPQLLLPAWSSIRQEAADACAATDAAMQVLLADERAGDLEEWGADDWEGDGADEPAFTADPAGALRALADARAAALEALETLGQAIRDGGRLELERLNALFGLDAAMSQASASFGLEPATTSLDELATRLEELAAREPLSGRLAEISRLEGPATVAQELSQARRLAEELLGGGSWDERAMALAQALGALVELSTCDPSNVEQLLSLEETARAGLPAELARLCALAGRGLHLAAEDPAPHLPGADQALGEPPSKGSAGPELPDPEPEPAEHTKVAEPEDETVVDLEVVAPEVVEAVAPPPAVENIPSEPVASAPPDPALAAPNPAASSNANPAAPEPRVGPADTAPAWSPEELTERLSALVAERRFGLAHWASCAGGRPASACSALEAAALAAALRSGAGDVAAHLGSLLGQLGGGPLEGEPVGQLLCLQAAVRASLLAPYPTEVDDLMQELGETFAHDLPALSVLAQAVREASLAGVSISAEDLSRGRDLAELEQAAGQAGEGARDLLDRPRSLNFQRATVIWRRWAAESGLVGGLLGPVARDERGRRQGVSSEVLRLRNHAEVEREIGAIDTELRGSGSEKLEGRARRILVKSVGDAVTIAGAWCDALAALDQRRPEASEPFNRLRRTVAELRPALGRELEALAETAPPELAAAARAAGAELEETLDLLDGRPLRGVEVSPALALGAGLLHIPVIDLDVGLRPRPNSPLTLHALAGLTDAVSAFGARMARRDLLGAASLLDWMEARGEDVGELRPRYHQAHATGRGEVDQRVASAGASLDLSRRQNYLSEDEWRDLTGRLERAGAPGRLDLDAALGELDAIEGEFAQAREATLERFRERLRERSAASTQVAQAAVRIEALLERGDLATAEEYLVLAEAGESPPSAEEIPDHLRRFFPAVPESLAGVGAPRILEAAARGLSIGHLDFATVSETQRKVVHRALEAWFGLFAGKKTDATSVRLALRLAGIEAAKVTQLEMPAPGRAWLELAGVQRIGDSLVPAFGSASGDTLRVLLCRSAEPETLLGWVSQDTSDRPVLVLQRGTLSPAQRRELASLCRKSGRTVAVIDDAVMAYLGAQGGRRFDTLMRITLAFSATNPYQPEVAGNVPVEMFYGRSEERSRIVSASGTSLIYGGRQLGKSALLRAAARRFEQTPEQVALYVDLHAAEIATQSDPGLVWILIHEQLCQRGLAGAQSRQPNATIVRGAINSWLEGNPQRRLLLLLDECDTFFDQDAAKDFQNTRLVRSLMDETGHRAKVVFAGLHQVQRFAGIPNQPLAHLGKPQPIGPLAPSQAFALLQVPLAALGFEADEDLLARALAYTNYSPLNLQLFGRALVELLLSRPPGPEGPPWAVTEADIEAVAESPALQAEIRGRFQLTLSLDPRYRVMAYVMAYRTYEDGPGKPLALRELRQECDEWWATGFAGLSADEFRALVEEMRGLGVLAVARSGGFIMRSPSVLRMLGTEDEVVTELVDAGMRELPPAGFMGALARRPLAGGAGPTRRSPLSEQQLAELVVERHTRIYLVVGTAATGIDMVAAAITHATRAIGRQDGVTVAGTRNSFTHALSGGSPGQHHVIVSDLRGVGEQSARESIALTQRVAPPSGVTRSVVFIGGPPSQAGLVGDPPEGLELVELRRYDQPALEAWAIDEQRAFQDADSRRRLLELTGGWPRLIERVSERLQAHGEEAETALGWLEQWLASPAGAETFLIEVGLDDEDLARCYRVIADTVSDPEPAGELEDLVSGLHPKPAAAIRLLRSLGILTVSPESGHLSPEPVLGGVWSSTHRSNGTVST
ncbi:MAG: hypothetical protein AB7I08_03140 [Thermoleophilia bacterium]